MKKYVAYYRVSTKKQGASGLGLEAQKETVKQYIEQTKGILIAEYTEIESGKNNERIELKKAINNSKEQSATLIIAKLDRLSRNASFTMNLRDAGVDFVACDLPDANTLTIGIFASLAQWERERISTRVKEALEAKKRQGYKLGKPENMTLDHRKKGAKSNLINSRNSKTNQRAFSLINIMRTQGKSYQDIANFLNSNEFNTVKNKEFFPATVRRIFLYFKDKK